MLISIENLWLKSNRQKNLKVRFRDWNYKIKYFMIEGYSNDNQKITGKLDSGEAASFAKDNLGWEKYYSGLEENARAI